MKDPIDPRALLSVMGREACVQLHTDAGGAAIGATAVQRVPVAASRVWSTIAEMWRTAGWVPIVRDIRRDGDRVEVDLRFRIALFSAGFRFAARASSEEGRFLELAWIEGEPRGIVLRFEVLEEGPAASAVVVHVRFDLFSLGWLVKYVLKHHPEIQPGVFAGTALFLVDAVRARSVAP